MLQLSAGAFNNLTTSRGLWVDTTRAAGRHAIPDRLGRMTHTFYGQKLRLGSGLQTVDLVHRHNAPGTVVGLELSAHCIAEPSVTKPCWRMQMGVGTGNDFPIGLPVTTPYHAIPRNVRWPRLWTVEEAGLAEPCCRACGNLWCEDGCKEWGVSPCSRAPPALPRG